MSQRKDLAAEALAMAEDVRANYGLVDDEPLSIYDLCRSLGVVVRFTDVNTPEGMYVPGRRPQFFISARRPAGRKAYTCAHELGHHCFKHGKRIDNLIQQARFSAQQPEEFLVDCFAGYLLMPVLGVQEAFVKRSWSAPNATPLQFLTIACEFGVGYQTMLTHACFVLNLITEERYGELKKVDLKTIRKEAIGKAYQKDRLLVFDEQSAAPVIEAEEGTLILVPKGIKVFDDIVVKEAETSNGILLRAARRGVIGSDFENGEPFKQIKVASYQWYGLDKFRHLEEEPDDD